MPFAEGVLDEPVDGFRIRGRERSEQDPGRHLDDGRRLVERLVEDPRRLDRGVAVPLEQPTSDDVRVGDDLSHPGPPRGPCLLLGPCDQGGPDPTAPMVRVNVRLSAAVRYGRPSHDLAGIVDREDRAVGGKVERLGDVIRMHLADTVVRELAGSDEREDRVDVSARRWPRGKTGSEIGQRDDPGLSHLRSLSGAMGAETTLVPL